MSDEAQTRVVPEISNPLQAKIYLTLTRFLGMIALIALGGVILLAANGKAIPESVVAFGATAVGALAGLLAPSPVK
ncbi:MAG TPA: hypothetical protein VN426_03220 [Syntrophomonadaceae bacterium]|nr:hypothetical protein [Syntrophomonadaceae bacterium]